VSESSSSGGGLGVTGVAIVVLATLKLAEVAPVASWSWAAVIFYPILIAVGLFAAIFGVFFVVGGAAIGGSSFTRWWGRRSIRKMMEKMDE